MITALMLGVGQGSVHPQGKAGLDVRVQDLVLINLVKILCL